MTKLELLRQIIKVLKETNTLVKNEMNGKDRDNPVNIEIIRTLKANFYEDVMELYRKYGKSRKGE